MRYLRLPLPPFAHNNLAFSPFYDHHLALASGSNFGLVGNGRVHVVKMDQQVAGGLGLVRSWDTADCVYDVAWSEIHENQIAAACGNGAIKLFDLALEGLPIQAWQEHTAEVTSIEWNNIEKALFVTGSWDQSVKVWNPSRQSSILTIPAHAGQIYSSTWSPHSPTIIATCASDGFIRIWDTRTLPSPIQEIFPPSAALNPMSSSSAGEMLSCDWNKYTPQLLAFSSQDGGVSTVDLRYISRNAEKMAVRLVGRHSLPARKVKWDPHNGTRLLSAGYDMTCRVWQTDLPPAAPLKELFNHQNHTEFVMAADWALFDPGLVASAGWDGDLHMYRV
ncbi:peroxin-7 [Cryptococcus neoformans]|nr:peroxin-7 [Cryptococcus neoformans var. grubii]